MSHGKRKERKTTGSMNELRMHSVFYTPSPSNGTFSSESSRQAFQISHYQDTYNAASFGNRMHIRLTSVLV